MSRSNNAKRQENPDTEPKNVEAGAKLDAALSEAKLPGLNSASFEGVTEVQVSKREKLVKIDFVEAAAHAHSKPSFVARWSEDRSYEVWKDANIRIVFTKFGPDKVAEDPALPPYSAIMMAQPGKRFVLETDRASSTLSDDGGHIVRAGQNVYKFYDSHEDTYKKKPSFTVTVDLDKVNDWSYPERPDVTPESRALKKAWNRFWVTPSEEESGGFRLQSTARKKLDFKTADEMRQLVGPAELIKIWERDNEAPLEEQHRYPDSIVFAFDPKSNSYGIGEYTEGESDHRLYIFKQDGSFVGFYRVGDDGSREWLEGFPGELGKPE
jgi:hypothetical protein